MTELYLDCEFNGTYGSFISLALYNPKGESFYEVDDTWEFLSTLSDPFSKDKALKDWVRSNVIPVLGKKAISRIQLQGKLSLYLGQFEDEIIIYADWPEDFKHLMSFLFTVNPNNQIPSKTIESLTMKLITMPRDHVSAIPHNALEDAKALYHNHLGMKK